MLLINLKNYEIDTPAFLNSLTKLFNEKYSKLDLYISPSTIELSMTRAILPPKIKVISQSTDIIEGSKSTGKITLSKLFQCGITGTILNHSENPKNYGEIEEICNYARRNGMETIVGLQRETDIEILSEFNQDFLLYEPSDLIGNSYHTDSQSVVDTKKDELLWMKNNFGNKKIIIGAGIKSEEDFQKAYELEFAGIALSSIITESPNILDTLDEIMSYELNYSRN